MRGPGNFKMLLLRQVAQIGSEFVDLAVLFFDRRIETAHDGIGFGLSKSLFDHVPEWLHIRLFFEIRPVLVRNDQHILTVLPTIGENKPAELNWPLGFLCSLSNARY